MLFQDFELLILDRGVLWLQRTFRKDIIVYEDESSEMAAYRHAAYLQFILWQYGKLTTGDRRVIPSCCVWKIRDCFPDPTGSYTGYVPGRCL